MEVQMKHHYPPRLSAAELHQELDAYLEYRRPRVDGQTIAADKSHISQFISWLETGRAGHLTRDEKDDLVREFTT
jgi:hypothetical protein